DAPRPPAPDTKFISLEMFEAGKSIKEIASLRNLACGTIEGHLAFHVGEGRLDIARILAPEKISELTEFFTRNPTATATVAAAKASFGDKYSYGELKMVAWHLRASLPSSAASSGP
ncbi:MAG: helix-turn-helix domain-containing protein, partial [Planctomycetales bacterium]|nr:helix-turn-helix domain-containing protein [Planctomycetales bacterium]